MVKICSASCGTDLGLYITSRSSTNNGMPDLSYHVMFGVLHRRQITCHSSRKKKPWQYVSVVKTFQLLLTSPLTFALPKKSHIHGDPPLIPPHESGNSVQRTKGKPKQPQPPTKSQTKSPRTHSTTAGKAIPSMPQALRSAIQSLHWRSLRYVLTLEA